MLAHNLRVVIVILSVSLLLVSSSLVVQSGNGGSSSNRLQPLSNTGFISGDNAVLITLYNNQSVATSSPFQEELIVNSSEYSSYEAANLSNVEFTSINGTVIPSWLESGNSNSNNNSVYWLNLTGIPAYSQISIYMVFLPIGEIAFNGINVGEASQLSGAFGSPSFGIYNDISHVMLTGLIYQFYYYPSSTITIPSYVNVTKTSLGIGVTIPGTSEVSSTNPFYTSVSGSTQYLYSSITNNVIINYKFEYWYNEGGVRFPSPPIGNPIYGFASKSIGWVNVSTQYTCLGTVSDDGIFASISSTGGNSTGIDWTSSNNSQNIINEYHQQGATYYFGVLGTGTQRLQIAYYQGGGAAYYGVFSISNVQYYHAALPPSGAMPGATFSQVKNIYSVTITENNLPAGIPWYLHISNSTLLNMIAGNNSTIFWANGMYNYSVHSSDDSYAPVNQTGNFTVSGSSTLITVPFYLEKYNIYFIEAAGSLLPSGTQWYANVTGTETVNFSSTESTFSANLPNGTYVVRYASDEGGLYQANGTTFNVLGGGNNLIVNFSKAYAVTFNEFFLSFLPLGTPWYVNVSNYVDSSTTSNNTTLYEPNGTFDYGIATTMKNNSAAPGSFTINGASTVVWIAFLPVIYDVTFLESGLPPDTNWYVNLSNGEQVGANSSTSNSIDFSLMNGTYTFNPACMNKLYFALPGGFTVNGSGFTIDLLFSFYDSNVTFSEHNLPSTATWYANVTSVYSNPPINISRNVLAAGVNLISMNLPNGTYNYTIQSADKIYFPEVGSGQFVVSGSSVNILTVFHIYNYTVNFIENGLPSGTSWSLKGSGNSLTSTGSSASVQLHNGTYDFSVTTGNSAYAPFLQVVSIMVSGHSINYTVDFIVMTSSVTVTILNLSSTVTTWYLNLSNGESILVHGQTVSLSLPYGSYSFTIGIPGAGTVYSGTFSLGSSPLDISISVPHYSTSGLLAVGLPVGGTAVIIMHSPDFLFEGVAQ